MQSLNYCHHTGRLTKQKAQAHTGACAFSSCWRLFYTRKFIPDENQPSLVYCVVSVVVVFSCFSMTPPELAVCFLTMILRAIMRSPSFA